MQQMAKRKGDRTFSIGVDIVFAAPTTTSSSHHVVMQAFFQALR